MLLESPMFKRTRTAATRGADSTTVTAIDLDDPKEVTGADSAEIDAGDDDGDDIGVDSLARANELRAESDWRHKRGRGKAKTLHSKSSVWTTFTVAGVRKNGKVACAICGFKIAISRMLSSNFFGQYQMRHT